MAQGDTNDETPTDASADIWIKVRRREALLGLDEAAVSVSMTAWEWSDLDMVGYFLRGYQVKGRECWNTNRDSAKAVPNFAEK